MARKKDKATRIRILNLIQEGHNPGKIAKLIKRSPSRISRLIHQLGKEGYVTSRNTFPKTYTVTPKGISCIKHASKWQISLGVKKPPQTPKPKRLKPLNNSKSANSKSFFSPTTQVHNYKIRIPILRYGTFPNRAKKISVNNWEKRIYKMKHPVKMNMELTTRNIILHYDAKEFNRDKTFKKELLEWSGKGISHAAAFFALHGFLLDIGFAREVNQHIANQVSEEPAETLKDAKIMSIDLGRLAKSVHGKVSEQRATAWMDESRGIPEVESNDLGYQENVIMMPERIQKMEKEIKRLNAVEAKYHESIALYDTQIRKHLELIKSMDKTMKLISKALAKK